MNKEGTIFVKSRIFLALMLTLSLLGAACQATTTTDEEDNGTNGSNGSNGEQASQVDPTKFADVTAAYKIPVPEGSSKTGSGEVDGVIQIKFQVPSTDPDAYEKLVTDAGWVVDARQPINSIKYKVHHMGLTQFQYAMFVFLVDGNVTWFLNNDEAARDQAYADR
jgi:hypothetical protein